MKDAAELSLYWTPESFIFEGVRVQGLPILFRRPAWRIEFLPTKFFVHLCLIRGRAASSKTWRTYGYAIRDFLRWMEANSFNWKRPQEEWLAAYCKSLQSDDLAAPTVKRNMSLICAFYEWSHLNAYITTLPITYESIRAWHGGLLAHVDVGRLSVRPIVLPSVPERRRYPRFYTVEDRDNIFQALDPHRDDAAAFAEPAARDQLILKWALYTGAREFEIASLTVDDIPEKRLYRHKRVYPVKIIRKRGVRGELYVPSWLLDETLQYINLYHRDEVMRAATERGKTVSEALFLGRWGSKISPKTIYRRFKGAVRRAGLRGTFHDLRHTYAITMLDKLMRLPQYKDTDGMNALLVLKILMGHKTISSTLHYLQARNFYLTEIFADLFELPGSLDA